MPYVVSNNPSKSSRIQVQVKWSKTQPGWVKINTYGSFFGNPRKAGGGGILWCSNGYWITGFARKFGKTSSDMAEVWALRDGLNLVRQLGIDNIFVEMDAKFLVCLLSNLSIVNLMLETLLNNCKSLMRTFTNCTMAHVYRKLMIVLTN